MFWLVPLIPMAAILYAFVQGWIIDWKSLIWLIVLVAIIAVVAYIIWRKL